VYEEPGNVKVLALDRLVHSYVVPDNPFLLKYDYLKIFTEVIGYGSGDNDTPRILHMGGGGYSLPRYLETVNPQSINEVVEIDPAVTKTAYEKLGLPSDMAIKTYNQDARLFLMQQQTQDKYNFIVGDVFNDFSTPYHLTTVEFNRVISSRMQPDGIYMINIIDDFKEGKFMPSMVYTLKQVFQNVIILSVSNDWVNAGLSTYVIIATDRSFDEADYRKSASDDGKNTAVGYAFWGSDLDRYLEERNPVLLSDDYVPTDIMVAEMLKKR
jgi:spermidine synthase